MIVENVAKTARIFKKNICDKNIRRKAKVARAKIKELIKHFENSRKDRTLEWWDISIHGSNSKIQYSSQTAKDSETDGGEA